MIEVEDKDALLALLAWWRAGGVDAALTHTAIDWTGRTDAVPGGAFEWPDRTEPGPAPTPLPDRTAPKTPSPGGTGHTAAAPTRSPTAPVAMRPTLAVAGPPGASRAFTTTTPDAATMAAREAARRAQTLDVLGATLADFEGCSLKATAKNLCFYRGSPQARLMLIGEAPGSEEDKEGKPFVGRSGQLLDRMLAAIGMSQADVHITNTIYWRPPGNRTPTPQETLVCKPFLDRQIELVAPDVIMTLGGPATKAVTGVADGILKVRGKWHAFDAGGRAVRVMPTLHPAYLLRTPAAKRQAWRDLLAVKAALAGTDGGAAG